MIEGALQNTFALESFHQCMRNTTIHIDNSKVTGFPTSLLAEIFGEFAKVGILPAGENPAAKKMTLSVTGLMVRNKSGDQRRTINFTILYDGYSREEIVRAYDLTDLALAGKVLARALYRIQTHVNEQRSAADMQSMLPPPEERIGV